MPRTTKTTNTTDPAGAELARGARARAGLTQQGMADLIGVHRITVARWESGEQAPDAPARALLRLIEARPREAVETLRA